MNKNSLYIFTLIFSFICLSANAWEYPPNERTINSGQSISNQSFNDTHLIIEITDSTPLNLNNVIFRNSIITINSGVVNINDSRLHDSTINADENTNNVNDLDYRLNITDTHFVGGYVSPTIDFGSVPQWVTFANPNGIFISGKPIINIDRSVFTNFEVWDTDPQMYAMAPTAISLWWFNSEGSLTLTNSTITRTRCLGDHDFGNTNTGSVKLINNTIFVYGCIDFSAEKPNNIFANNIFHTETLGTVHFPSNAPTQLYGDNNLFVSASRIGISFISPDSNVLSMYDYYDLPDAGLPGAPSIFPREYKLVENSPAINAGNNSLCPSKDQNGQARNDGACDIGAAEYQHPVTSPDVVLDIRQNQCPNRTKISVNNPNASLDFVIAGNIDFDTNDILSYELELEGEPINMRRLIRNVDRINNERLNYEPSPTLCLPKNKDGIKDMMIHIYHSDVIDAVRRKLGRDPAHNEVVELTISGELKDGTEFEASDFLQIRH